jgi:hypothetical protein
MTLPEQSNTTEADLSARIDVLRRQLDAALRQRSGMLADGLPGYGWCCLCGDVLVNAADGWDTCTGCDPRAGRRL